MGECEDKEWILVELLLVKVWNFSFNGEVEDLIVRVVEFFVEIELLI